MYWKTTLLALIINFSLIAQADSSQLQIEFAGSIYPYRNALGLHGQMGVNFEQKNGWYNNVSLATTTQDYTVKGAGSLIHFSTFSVGKVYQFQGDWLYFSAGLNAGIYYTDWHNDNLATRNYGLCVVPRLEAGYNAKKIVLSIGVYSALGFGVYQKFIDGAVYHSNSSGFFDKFHFGSVGIPYVKLVLK